MDQNTKTQLWRMYGNVERPSVETDDDDGLWHQISVAYNKQDNSFSSGDKSPSNECTHLAGLVSFDKQT